MQLHVRSNAPVERVKAGRAVSDFAVHAPHDFASQPMFLNAMTRHYEKSVLPYTQAQLYELVADVERYPEFVPCWIEASVRRRTNQIVQVEQVLNLGAVRRRFVSRAVLQPPTGVRVTSDDGPFRRLDIQWGIEPLPEQGCTLSLATEFELRSGMLSHLLGGFFRGETGRLLRIFENRAHALYGAAAIELRR